MLHSNEFSYPSSGFLPPTNQCNQQVQDRLALYQVFLRVYEQNRELLHDILEMENSGNRLISATTLTYVQGIVIGDLIYLVTNLLEGTTQVINHTDACWTIGRDRRVVTLPIADRRLSRKHAAITYATEQQRFQLMDLNSTNGTFINNEQVVQSQPLQDGDRIRLGGVSFRFFACHLPMSSSQVLRMDNQADGSSNPGEGQRKTAGLEHAGRKTLNDAHIDSTLVVPVSMSSSDQL